MSVFKEALKEANIPVSEKEIKEQFARITASSDVEIRNESPFSAFWRLLQEIAIKPVFYITKFLYESVYPNLYIATAKGRFLDLISEDYGIARKQPNKMQGYITFTRDSINQELVVPRGVVVSANISGNLYRLTSIEQHTFAVDEQSKQILMQAENHGSVYNLKSSSYTILESSIAGISSVNNESNYIVSVGADIETDDALRGRIKAQFTSVGSWHINATYISIMTRIIGLDVDRVYIETNAPRGAGTANIYVLFDNDEINQELIDAAQNYIMLEGNHGHGDDVLVQVLPSFTVDVSCDIKFYDYITTQNETLSKVETFIRCAFRQNKEYVDHVSLTKPHDLFAFSKLSQELHNVFSEIESINWNTADIESDLNIPILGVFVLNVN